jgi:thymidylate synthase
MTFQFFVANGKLSLHMLQRSCDMFLGVPFNIASYALLLAMVAQVTDLKPHECVLTLNDAHIYHEHFKAVEEQLEREPMKLPKLWLNPDIKDIDKFTMDDIKLVDYEHHPAIKAEMIV